MESPVPDHLLKLGTGFFASKALLSAVEMELFTVLAKRPETLADLSSRLGLHPRAARDFLDALVALGFLERNDGHLRQHAGHRSLPRQDKPSYIGGMLEMANAPPLSTSGATSPTALRTGQPQNEARNGGDDPFTALYADPARLRSFLRAMTGISHGANLAIARQFPGRTTRPSSTSAPRRATSSPRSRSPTRTSPASALTCPRSAPSSRNTSPPTASPTASASSPAASSTRPSPRPTSS